MESLKKIQWNLPSFNCFKKTVRKFNLDFKYFLFIYIYISVKSLCQPTRIQGLLVAFLLLYTCTINEIKFWNCRSATRYRISFAHPIMEETVCECFYANLYIAGSWIQILLILINEALLFYPLRCLVWLESAIVTQRGKTTAGEVWPKSLAVSKYL